MRTARAGGPDPVRPGGIGPWRFVVWFGLVSLLADFVYEGARSVTGPLLASLGASALVVGVVTGAGEAAALVRRRRWCCAWCPGRWPTGRAASGACRSAATP